MSGLARRALPFAAAALLSACALDPNSSYVTQVQHPTDPFVLGHVVADFAALRLPARSAIALDPTPEDQAGNAVTPALARALRERGFAVVEGNQPAPAGAHRLRYLVTPLDNGDLVRLTLDGSTQGARFLVRNTAGGLQSGGPFTMTQAEAAL